ncbi:hypothetical protein KSC_007460 [Ktedonobacter sp. SOSP1-52]|uniref:outer membrane protein assembly factor BamB family protein n=1 Tax=Ktedonobacter sp. SOSP1-52 TaxID=2778366 RepID=UPI001915C0F6|nr:PQQ-binding-like beta-propeller repeat protein [Ktedonobacter sp. SOSP1-52]GHO61854.1 hypothetical protein KSC_007460 [Ktedonobacter sp. SOSP1-52]
MLKHDRQQRLAYEKTLYRYSTALERGDLDTIITILQEAEDDPYLEHLIFEMHQDGYQKEEPTMSHVSSKQPPATEETPPLELNRSLRSQPEQAPRTRKRWLTTLRGIAAVAIVAILIGSALLIFSAINVSHNLAENQQTSTGSSNKTLHNIVVAAELTFAGPTAGREVLTARDASTGVKLWSYTVPKGLDGKVFDIKGKKGLVYRDSANPNLVVQDHVVYFAGNKQVLALHALDGTLIWQTDLGTMDQHVVIGYFLPSLVVEQGRVYASGYSQGNLYTLDAKTGKIIWHYDASQPALLSVNKGVAYVTANEHYIKALDGNDGHTLWTKDVQTMPISATVANNVFYVQVMHSLVDDPKGSHKDQRPLIALNATTGTQSWSVMSQASNPTDLVVVQNMLVLFDGSHFCGYHTSDGTHAWCTTGPQNTVSGVGIASNNGSIYGIFNLDGGRQRVQAINPQNGKIYWSKDVDGVVSNAPLILPFGNSLVLPLSRAVLDQATGKELWHFAAVKDVLVIAGGAGM